MISRERRLPRWARRLLYAIAGVALLYVLIGPLTSIDAAQAAGVPLLTDKLWFRIATTVAMFVVMASGWNIIGGLTGYASFGNIAFFGLGAYTVGVLVSSQRLPFPLAILVAPLIAAVFGLLVGLALAAAALSVFVTWIILRSRFGYGLLAIRENEEAATVIGVNTTLYKAGAFCVAAALTGLAGGIFAQWNSFISQELTFGISENVQMILMAVVGGAGTVLGPVAGAIVLSLLIQTLAGGGATAVYAQVGLGVLLMTSVIFMPRGVIDFFGGRSKLTLGYLRQTLRETSA
jgi:branched-chain amino acid transport system permease protein